MKKYLLLLCAVLIMAATFTGCTAIYAETLQENENVSVIYEAFFLNNDEIRNLFAEVRGPDAPYAIMTANLHVTTAFMPQKDMHEFYGTAVNIHIYAYQAGEVCADEGNMTANEGFFCTVKTDNADLQRYLDSLNKNWHITGSYNDQNGAKYTEALDLTGARKVDYTVTGHFGGYMSNNTISFSPDADKIMATEIHDANVNKLPASSDLEHFYQKNGPAQIYCMERPDLYGYEVQNASIKNGYIMLTLRSNAHDAADDNRLVLFPVGNPDALACIKASPCNHYSLLGNGTVLEVSDESTYTLYNARLEKICSGQADGQFLGASDTGDLWFFTTGEQLALHRANTQTIAIDATDLVYCTYLGQSAGTAYFDVVSKEYGQRYLCVDLQSHLTTEVHMLHDVFDVSNGAVCYYSNDYWSVASLDDPLTVLMFTKPYSDETMWQMDDRFLIGQQWVYDDDTQQGNYNYCVYDKHSGGLCSQYAAADLAEHEASLLAYDQGLILYADTDHDGVKCAAKLYLWDLRDQPQPPSAKYHKILDFHIDQARIDALTGILHNIYDIAIYYDEEHLAAVSRDYLLPACTDTEKIGYTLIMLRECMAEYPRGFFDELRTPDFHHVAYYLCNGHIPVSNNTTNDAVATTSSKGDTLTMTFDVQQWWDLRSYFLHENTHFMEKRLEAEAWKINQADYNEYWYDSLNSPDYPSMQSYVWQQTGDNLKGVYDYDFENAWYIDAYSKCTMLEDRARTMDRGIHSRNEKYYQSPHINKKLRFLNALIREVFPCVQHSQEVFWEARTGIVDLYKEFPDFAGTR